jgi:hypothetical protein
MVLIAKGPDVPLACYQFDAEIVVVSCFHNQTSLFFFKKNNIYAVVS